jgi:hypothetical protein
MLWLSVRSIRIAPRVFCVGFVVHRLASGQGFLRVLSFNFHYHSSKFINAFVYRRMDISIIRETAVSLHHKRMKRKCECHMQSTVAYEQVATYNYGLSVRSSAKSNLGNMKNNSKWVEF